MNIIKIRLQSIEEVKKFVNIMAQLDGYFDLSSGRYIVDAKSVMGIFSMDLTRVLDLHVLETKEQEQKIIAALQPFICEE